MMIKTKFNLTEAHLKLIQRMNIRYDDYFEFGAPAVCPKRPYGNSAVYYDIGEIVGIDPEGGEDDDPEFTSEQEALMLEIHKETALALQVVLASACFDPGMYESDEYRDNWKKVVNDE
jgi:hypothetical protein